MAEHIYRCLQESSYTLEKKCPKCSSETILPRPPKFSLGDKYAGMRRESKKEELHQKGWY